MDFNIRKATKKDLPEVLALINELANFENAPKEVTIKLEDLEKDGFGYNPLYWIILAENKKSVIGMSFYYIRYSTWKGKCLYLEDLVVKAEYRGQKIGAALFEATIKAAQEMNAKQMNWQVLDWNEPAITFYKKFNAELDEEWMNGKIRF